MRHPVVGVHNFSDPGLDGCDSGGEEDGANERVEEEEELLRVEHIM